MGIFNLSKLRSDMVLQPVLKDTELQVDFRLLKHGSDLVSTGLTDTQTSEMSLHQLLKQRSSDLAPSNARDTQIGHRDDILSPLSQKRSHVLWTDATVTRDKETTNVVNDENHHFVGWKNRLDQMDEENAEQISKSGAQSFAEDSLLQQQQQIQQQQHQFQLQGVDDSGNSQLHQDNHHRHQHHHHQQDYGGQIQNIRENRKLQHHHHHQQQQDDHQNRNDDQPLQLHSYDDDHQKQQEQQQQQYYGSQLQQLHDNTDQPQSYLQHPPLLQQQQHYSLVGLNPESGQSSQDIPAAPLCNSTVDPECPDFMNSWDPTLSTPLVTTAVVGTLLLIIFIVSLTINLTVLFMFWRRKLRLTVSSRFLLNLSLCHVITAIFILPCALVSLILQTWVFGEIWCRVTGSILNLVIAASTLTLIAIAIDRHCAIVSPLHYPLKLTTRRCHAMICGVWTIALVCALPPVFESGHMEFKVTKMICTVKWTNHMEFDSYYNLFIVTMCFFMPLVVLVWVYAIIFRAAKANSKRTMKRNSVLNLITASQSTPSSQSGSTLSHVLGSNSNSTPSMTSNGGSSSATPGQSLEDSPVVQPNNGRRRSSTIPIMGRRVSLQRLGNLLWYREERKTAVTCIAIFLTFIGCWLPYFAVILIETFIPPSEFLLPGIAETLSIMMALSSCALDPLLYVVRNSQLRHEIYEMLKSSPPVRQNSPQMV